MPVTLGTITVLDGNTNAIQVQVLDQSGTGLGPFTWGHVFVDGVAGVLRAQVTAANALKVDGSAVTQPISGTITANIGTAGPLALETGGNLATLAGTVTATKVGTKEIRSATATETNVASSASSVTILASNASRLGATVFNDSTQILFLLLGTGPASSTIYTVQMPSLAYYEVPFNFTGQLTGIWASANGNARVTELT